MNRLGLLPCTIYITGKIMQPDQKEEVGKNGQSLILEGPFCLLKRLIITRPDTRSFFSIYEPARSSVGSQKTLFL
jgi:hypothetical protein